MILMIYGRIGIIRVFFVSASTLAAFRTLAMAAGPTLTKYRKAFCIEHQSHEKQYTKYEG